MTNLVDIYLRIIEIVAAEHISLLECERSVIQNKHPFI